MPIRLTPHMRQKAAELETASLQTFDNAPGLLFQLTCEVGIYDVLAGYGCLQHLHVQNVTFHDAQSICLARELQALGVAQVERQSRVGLF